MAKLIKKRIIKKNIVKLLADGSYGFKLTPPQQAAFDVLTNNKFEEITEIVYGGAAGGGKTTIGCIWIAYMAMSYPDTHWIIGRKQLIDLKSSTLLSLRRILDEMELQQDIHYKINAQDKTYEFTNGSTIYYLALDFLPSDPEYEWLGGYEFTGGFIDEAAQITEKCKEVLINTRIGRWNNTLYDIPGKLLLTCNPSQNWIKQYHTRWEKNMLDSHEAYIPAYATDNPDLDKRVLAKMNRLKGTARQRLLLGNWDYDELRNSLISEKEADFCFENSNVQPTFYSITADVARFGSDKAVIILWNGLRAEQMFEYDISSTTVLENKIKSLMEIYTVQSKHVIIDSDGVGGGVADTIPGCTQFTNNLASLNGENYQNLRTQCWYKLAQMVKMQKVYINCTDETLKAYIRAELSCIEEKESESFLKCSNKEDIKKALGRSSDYGDSIMMRMYLEIVRTYPVFVV